MIRILDFDNSQISFREANVSLSLRHKANEEGKITKAWLSLAIGEKHKGHYFNVKLELKRKHDHKRKHKDALVLMIALEPTYHKHKEKSLIVRLF